MSALLGVINVFQTRTNRRPIMFFCEQCVFGDSIISFIHSFILSNRLVRSKIYLPIISPAESKRLNVTWTSLSRSSRVFFLCSDSGCRDSLSKYLFILTLISLAGIYEKSDKTRSLPKEPVTRKKQTISYWRFCPAVQSGPFGAVINESFQTDIWPVLSAAWNIISFQ